jgi:hypothetical protein
MKEMESGQEPEVYRKQANWLLRNPGPRGRYVERVLLFAAIIFFFVSSFHPGWIRSETDFPNYYTAARLLLKHAPIAKYYDWPWFQKQMNFAGVENQLGGYIPQTPLTMLPVVAFAGFTPQVAKRCWLVLNLGFLAGTIYLLSRLTTLGVTRISLFAFTGYGTMHTNFLFGQYYVFLLFLLTLGLWRLTNEKKGAGGFLYGAAFALKLYGAPFAVYFLLKRHWRALAGMIVGFAMFLTISIIVFGWSGNVYFATHILPRALRGETLDPYHSGNGTIITLLRRTFVREAELNPKPLWDAPWMFFLLRPFIVSSVLLLGCFLVWHSKHSKYLFAWFFVLVILLSPNTASYTLILLLLPLTILLEESSTTTGIFLLGTYWLLNLPLGHAWMSLFPRVILLLGIVAATGRRYWRVLRIAELSLIAFSAAAIAGIQGWRNYHSYLQEPAQRWEHVAEQRGALYSSFPVALRSGIAYESIGKAHYVLRWYHANRNEELTFAGEAFHPVALSPDGPLQFELVAHGISRTMLLNLFTRKVIETPRASISPSGTSPDGRWMVSVADTGSSQQIWLRRRQDGRTVRLTDGDCNSFAPAWELDSSAVLFASDCNRGIGLPTLYRARIDRVAFPR